MWRLGLTFPDATCTFLASFSLGSGYSLILACLDIFTVVIMFECKMYLWGSFVGILGLT